MWTLLRGAMVTKALGLVADLGIADELAAGPRSVAELAATTAADEDALYRFLRALASDGVFSEEAPRLFANTPLSELLITDRAGSWRDITHLFGDVWFRTFLHAGESLETGEPAFPAVFDADFWTWLAEHPDESLAFNRAMASGADQNIGPLAELEWRDGETLVDVGGGNGATLAALLGARPELQGVVFDLPGATREAETLIREAGLSDRCTIVTGSFFESVPSGDTYLLASILHDWDDENALRILHTVRAGAPANARVLIRDSVIPPGDEAHGNKWLDLLMLVLLRGRERTEEEWRKLLSGAGFEVASISDGLIVSKCR